MSAATLYRTVDALGGDWRQTTVKDVTAEDRAAVTAFHDIQIKRIMRGDSALGDNRDVIERAFAEQRVRGYCEALDHVLAILAERGFSEAADAQVPA